MKNMLTKDPLIEYLLRDIECWQHHPMTYPTKIPCPFNGELSVGASYTTKQFSNAEEKIKNYFSQKSQSIEIMNPLYQFGGKNETAITVDILLDSEIQDKKNQEKETVPAWFDEIQRLLKKHKKRTEDIFSFGGDVSMKKENGSYFSRDQILEDTERKIKVLVSSEEKTKDLMGMVMKGNSEATEVLQWLPKNEKTVNFLITVLEQSRLQLTQYNFLFRQLIPCLGLLNKIQTERLINLSNTLLQSSVPTVRNKILSILSMFSAIDLQFLSGKCRTFIVKIAETEQLNCSYPAKEIIKKLKPLKMHKASRGDVGDASIYAS